MTHFSIGLFIICLGFFIYGLRLLQEGLGVLLADRLRFLIVHVTQSRIRSFISGIVMTFIFQSSQAVNITLIGFANVSLLTLRQAIPMSLGADLGTALLVFLLAVCAQADISGFAIMTLALGLLANIVLPKRRFGNYLKCFLGFGFVLFGLTSLSGVNEAVKESKLIQEILLSLSSEPIFACLLAAAMSAMLQSSAVVLGLLISLSTSGLLSLSAAIPLVAGANVGGIFSPVIASFRSNIDGRRVAFLHACFKVTGAFVLVLFHDSVAMFIHELSESVTFQIAYAHIGLNLFVALLYYPLTERMAHVAKRVIREHPKDKRFEPKYLDLRVIQTPLVAFANVHREILRMTEIAQEMFSHVLTPFYEQSMETTEYIDQLDDKIDLLNREIKLYLAKLNQAELSDAEGKRQIELMMLTSSIEGVGDVISNDFMKLAEKKRRLGFQFSQEGWEEIKDYHKKVMDNFQLAVTCLATGDEALGKQALKNKKFLAQYEQELGQKHLLRLHRGHKESIDTSALHLDLLSNLRRVNSVVCKMAYPVIDRRRTA